ncbi:hypothetical protein NDU88_004655 [Pleurodeles waltl]|uniref:Uncharacterized protein n=1 Tax=Pleurodeles waltl TaxID=8319 RepID=A0AAV7W919_PLEWA|nr:hypothetical protein NDU88_004655 [Pleurodeles waltl]
MQGPRIRADTKWRHPQAIRGAAGVDGPGRLAPGGVGQLMVVRGGPERQCDELGGCGARGRRRRRRCQCIPAPGPGGERGLGRGTPTGPRGRRGGQRVSWSQRPRHLGVGRIGLGLQPRMPVGAREHRWTRDPAGMWWRP